MILFTDLHDLTHYELGSKFLRKTYVIHDRHMYNIVNKVILIISLTSGAIYFDHQYSIKIIGFL